MAPNAPAARLEPQSVAETRFYLVSQSLVRFWRSRATSLLVIESILIVLFILIHRTKPCYECAVFWEIVRCQLSIN